MSGNRLQGSTVRSQGYGSMPQMVARDRSLSIEAVAIYSYLVSFAGKGNSAYPSVSIMCHELNIGENRFYKHRKQLVDAGYITITKHENKGTFNNNIYILEEEPYRQNKGMQNKGMQNKGTITNSSITNSYTTSTDHSTAKAEQDENVEEEIVEQIPFKEIIEYLNKETDKNFNFKSKGNRNLIKARWNEDYRLDDFMKVVDTKVKDWLDDEKMNQYLRPNTLFRPSNFDEYLNQVGSSGIKQKLSVRDIMESISK